LCQKQYKVEYKKFNKSCKLLQKISKRLKKILIFFRTSDLKIWIENGWLTKSNGWVDVKAVSWIAYSNQKDR
jgi:hypothetical protein